MASLRRAAAPLGSLDFSHVRPFGRLPQPRVLKTRFCGMQKSSMFAAMPLDNHMVTRFAAPQLLLAFLDRLELRHDRSDL